MVALLALAGTATAVEATGSPVAQPGQDTYAATIATRQTPILPPQALAEVIKRMPGNAFVSISIGQPPSGPPSHYRAGLPWLYATVAMPALDQGLDIKPLWIADLVTGAVADLSGSAPDLYTDFGGATFTAQLPDGTTTELGGGELGDIARGQVFDQHSDANVVESIRNTLSTYGLHALRVDVLHPLDNAVAVSASTNDPLKTLARFGEIRDALFGAPPKYDGYYFEIVDASGDALVRASAAFRSGVGRFWTAPGFTNDVSGEMSLSRPPH